VEFDKVKPIYSVVFRVSLFLVSRGKKCCKISVWHRRNNIHGNFGVLDIKDSIQIQLQPNTTSPSVIEYAACRRKCPLLWVRHGERHMGPSCIVWASKVNNSSYSNNNSAWTSSYSTKRRISNHLAWHVKRNGKFNSNHS
jgi:hypothetical protein